MLCVHVAGGAGAWAEVGLTSFKEERVLFNRILSTDKFLWWLDRKCIISRFIRGRALRYMWLPLAIIKWRY